MGVVRGVVRQRHEGRWAQRVVVVLGYDRVAKEMVIRRLPGRELAGIGHQHTPDESDRHGNETCTLRLGDLVLEARGSKLGGPGQPV